jgi:hypothetical protein
MKNRHHEKERRRGKKGTDRERDNWRKSLCKASAAIIQSSLIGGHG